MSISLPLSTFYQFVSWLVCCQLMLLQGQQHLYLEVSFSHLKALLEWLPHGAMSIWFMTVPLCLLYLLNKYPLNKWMRTEILKFSFYENLSTFFLLCWSLGHMCLPTMLNSLPGTLSKCLGHEQNLSRILQFIKKKAILISAHVQVFVLWFRLFIFWITNRGYTEWFSRVCVCACVYTFTPIVPKESDLKNMTQKKP